MAKNSIRTIFGVMEFGRQANFDKSLEMVNLFLESGNAEFDNAFMYAGGKSEEFMGKMEILKDEKKNIIIATKANPFSEEGLKPSQVKLQLNTSLARLQKDCVDIFYLHAPDHNTEIAETLKAVHQLHTEGKFKEFGLSNFASWEVAEIYYMCQLNGYVKPTVYQGMYNYVSRSVEQELFPCLRRLGIRFYAYNPLAGGLLTGKYSFDDTETRRPYGRFFGTGVWADKYIERYWKKQHFENLERVKSSLDRIYGEGKVSLTSAAIRWLYHHSKMSGSNGDAVILGASNIKQLSENLTYSNEGPLHEDVVKEMDNAWKDTKAICPNYFR